ncbi:MAG: N-acetylmuramoyl-L-alanine amidase [Candidatus Latescibacterota bacterium]
MRRVLRIVLFLVLAMSASGPARSAGNDRTPRGVEGLPVADAKGTRDPQGSRWQEKVRQQNASYIDSVRWWTSDRSTRVVIDLKREATYSVHRLSNPPRLYIDIEKNVLDPPKQEWSVRDGLVRAVRACQFREDIVRVVLDLEAISSYNVFPLTNPHRIVFDVFPERTQEATPTRDPSLAGQLGAKVKTIVLDPGHGGKDPGAIAGRLQEKTLVLDISRRLENLLKDEYQVYMTRRTDVFIPLESRTAFANQKGADLFVSVHANLARSDQAQGIETFYLSLASDREARELAAYENAMAAHAISDLEGMLEKILKNTKLKESRWVAEGIQRDLIVETGRKNRGVKRAPFVVLIGANMPSVLTEVSFISNKMEARLLSTEAYREKIARALANGILRYTNGLTMKK